MYCITRTQKIKDRNQINAAALHNFRLRVQANVDAKKSPENQILINNLDVDPTQISSLQEKLTAYYNGLGVKEKKDNVLMMEFVATASPEFFEKKTQKEIKEWANHQIEFFSKKFGSQVKLAILHLDEKTPHVHIMIGTEQKTVKKYKNQKGEFFKETWSLNAKRYNPEFLRQYQTEFATWNEKYGLKRGKKRSQAEKSPIHISPKEYQKTIDEEMELIKKAKDSREAWLNFQKVTYPKIKANIENLIDSIDSLLDILKTKDLTEDEQMYLDAIAQKQPKKTKDTPLKRR